jgi:hypothetical protein
MADQLQRARHRAAAPAQGLGQIVRRELVDVPPRVREQRVVDAGVLNQAVRVEQARADDGREAIALLRRRLEHPVEPARLRELDVGVHQHHVAALVETSL